MKTSCIRLQKMGVEPTRYFYHTDLNRARLPIPPLLRSAALSGNGFIIPNDIHFVNKNFQKMLQSV